MKIETGETETPREKSGPPVRLNICLLGRFAPDGTETLSISRSRIDPQMQICLRLAEMGHGVHCILPCEAHGDDRPFFIQNTRVYPLPQPRVKSVLRRMARKVSAVLRKTRLAVNIVREHKCNLVFTREEDVFDGLIALYIKIRYRVPFVFELVSPLEMGWEIAKIEGRKPRFFWYALTGTAAFTRIAVMKHAGLILPTTGWFEDALVKKGIPGERLLPFPNGVDAEKFKPDGGQAIRDKYGLGKSGVVIYVGTMDKARRLAILIEALQIVKKQNRNVKLLMVGDGSDRQNLEALAARSGVARDVIFTGQIPQAEVPEFIAAADVALSAVPPLSFYICSSPIKLLEYMAAAKPVVANEEIMEQRKVLAASGGGILVPFTPEAFAGAIIDLLGNKTRAVRMGLNGRSWVTEYRSFDFLARRLEQRYLKLVNAPFR
jgi:glycosyltransferase involved in cell wall biosynthesis